MVDQENILDVLSDDSGPGLERVRLNENQTAILPFTKKGVRCSIHYCDALEVHDYILCLGRDCLLCRTGKKSDERFLLPVFLPASHCVAVLPVSTSLRPNALLPQLGNILKAEKPTVAFVSRDGPKFSVSSSPLPDDADAGEEQIKRFLKDYEDGKIDLVSVFQHLENDQLKRWTGREGGPPTSNLEIRRGRRHLE